MSAETFEVAPWTVHEPRLELDRLGHTESIFALSNGHLGLRGNLDEGEPVGEPGTYLNGFYETRTMPYAERAYGDPEDGQTMINVTNGKIIRLLVDDEPFDVRYGEVVRHARTLDLREGVLVREVDWRSPTGVLVRVRTTRLVSFVHRAVAAIRYEVEPLEGPARVVVQSELVANEPLPAPDVADPRWAAPVDEPLVGELHGHHELRAGLMHRTRGSGLRMAAAMDHVVEGPEGTATAIESRDDLARMTVTSQLQQGATLTVTKLLAYGWSSQRSTPALRDQAEAALADAGRAGWDGLRSAQRSYLDDVWARADVEIEGDAALQQALRFGIFAVIQAGARAEQRAIPAKGLTGSGYDGQTFWDSETFALRMLTFVDPDAAGDALRWRHSTLDLARERAGQLGLAGAAFPWRTISGQECSGYWPAATAAFHVNADIADAVRRYVWASGDETFARAQGLELLVETARLWRSLGHHDGMGGFRIDGVTGPDEYSALGDNNVFTNLMAARNLREAAQSASSHPDRALALGVDEEEVAAWRDAAAAIVIPFDAMLGVHPQSDGFTRQRQWDFASMRPDQYPLMLSFPYYALYSSQVVKQADLVHALDLCAEAFDADTMARDFAYYERITVRDSSLSAAVQSIVAARVGALDLADAYLGETALVDLRDLTGNTHAGLHIASLAGGWLAVVFGFGGMREGGDRLGFAPRMPARLNRIAFRVMVRGRSLSVSVDRERASYALLDGEPLTIEHYGERVTVTAGHVQARDIPAFAAPEPIQQPAGRAPRVPHDGR